MSRSVVVVAAMVMSAMLPFFGDVNALIGAFGYLPVDFVMPAVLYNVTFSLRDGARSSGSIPSLRCVFHHCGCRVNGFRSSDLSRRYYLSAVRQWPRVGRYYVGPIQFVVCYGAVIGSTLLGGQSMKSIYLITNPDGTMKLYEFIVIFGTFMLILVQIPSFHSLRHINLISLVLCLSYSACATAGSIYAGHSSKAPQRDYSISGSGPHRVFGVFNAVAIIAATFGNGIIPEIQATVAAPVKGKMFKGLCLCYMVVCCTFFSVAVSGYWAFGNGAAGTVVANFLVDGRPIIPKRFLILTNLFTLLQLLAVAVVYLQPTNEVLEGKFADPKSDQYSARNVVPRLMLRSLAVATATVISAMLPFFGDINAVLGAFGFLPLDFVMPAILYNVTFRPPRRNVIYWVNSMLAIVFTVFAVVASVAAVRQIALDAKTYKLFANV
ncbi:GABA transporter 1 [Acorus calamus]|uniref:GABA transporter 1 n=1 Tax=Acorus calamus TaxID=4465 RepID=A0AAV9FBD8_ACOCL|nr:GABA transporter 1 [Acorus calamus]